MNYVLIAIGLFAMCVAVWVGLVSEGYQRFGMWIIAFGNAYVIVENQFLHAWDHWFWHNRADAIGDTIGFLICALGLYFVWKGRRGDVAPTTPST